uniref:MRG domain-containing protein n=1 Tax=Panagrolaimus superbus TaxID=310955 RepID=A0A914YR00_9BILA
MAGKKKALVNTTTNNNVVARLKIKASISPNREISTPSSASDDTQISQRLTDTLPRFIAPEYVVNTPVICQYSDSYYYDAKIVKVQKKNDTGECLYTIHYNGWNQRYDEEITHAEACQKFLVYNPENLAIAKRELTEARKRKHSKSSQKKPEKRQKKEDPEENTSQPATVKSARTRTQSSNTRQSSSTSRADAGVEASNNEADTEDDFHPAPYLAQYLKASYDSENFDKTKFVEDIDALIVYFNKMVNMRILHKFEFVQHLDLLNSKRRLDGLPDLLMNNFLEQQDEFNGPESPGSEEAKDDEDTAFKPPKQIKADATIEGEPEKRQLRETRNKKNAIETPPKVVMKPKKKEKPIKPVSENFERENNFNFVDSYGFIHLVRFLYYYNSLLSNKTIANAIYIDYAELINDIIEFVSMNVEKYFNIVEDYETATPAYQRQAFSP